MTHFTAKTAASILAAFAITVTASASAQTPVDNINLPKVRQEQVLEMFRTSLKSDYQGVVEGTIYNIVIFKKYYPELDYSQLLTMLYQNTKDNDDAALRFKAHLAAMYLSDDTGITIVPVAHPSDHEYIFRQIAEQLEKKLLVTN
jgi:hypothetical protein